MNEPQRVAGCPSFIVHAHNAWLKGLSPKANCEVPPLRYDVAYQLKRDFPQLTIAVNGGITTNEQVAAHLRHLDSAMLGREAYHNPWWRTSWDAAFYATTRPEATDAFTRKQVEAQMCDYMVREMTEHGTPWSTIARRMLGLRHDLPGSRRWRQVWSEHKLKELSPHALMALAHEAGEP